MSGVWLNERSFRNKKSNKIQWIYLRFEWWCLRLSTERRAGWKNLPGLSSVSTCPKRANFCFSSVVLVDTCACYRAHVVCSSVHPIASSVKRICSSWF